MDIKSALKAFVDMLARIWKVIFQIFSATTLYAVIAVCINFLMEALGVSGNTIDAILILFTGLVILYIIVKACYLVSTWLKKRRGSETNDKNA